MTSTYIQAIRGKFSGIMSWADLDSLWQRILQDTDGWYLYDTNAVPPTEPLAAIELASEMDSIRQDLHTRHKHDYCGIVYADNPAEPTFIKIYDPDNLGVVCGFSDNPPLPRWILSHIPAEAVERHKPKPGGWRRWIPGKL